MRFHYRRRRFCLCSRAIIRYDAVGAIQMAFRWRANNASLLYANWARRALIIWYYGMADAGDDLLVIIESRANA